jgi:hypothetical protein
MKRVEVICADSQFNLARTLRQATMIREIIKNDALRQREPQLILASTIYEEYGIDLMAGEPADTSRHTKAIHDPKMWPGGTELGKLRNKQVHFFENRR